MSTLLSDIDSNFVGEPFAIDGYETRVQSQNIVHTTLTGGIAVTLIPPRPRSGRLELMFDSEAAAVETFNGHREYSLFVIMRDDTSVADMTYVTDGDVSMRLEVARDGRSVWRVSVGYQEVHL